MVAVEPLYNLVNFDTSKLSKEEKTLLEIDFFVHIYRELKAYFRLKDYFPLMKFPETQEHAMLDANLLSLVIKDIISTDEYTLEGIAYYTYTHTDVIYDVITGKNTSPSLTLYRKILELHRSIRQELYQTIMKKLF